MIVIFVRHTKIRISENWSFGSHCSVVAENLCFLDLLFSDKSHRPGNNFANWTIDCNLTAGWGKVPAHHVCFVFKNTMFVIMISVSWQRQDPRRVSNVNLQNQEPFFEWQVSELRRNTPEISLFSRTKRGVCFYISFACPAARTEHAGATSSACQKTLENFLSADMRTRYPLLFQIIYTQQKVQIHAILKDFPKSPKYLLLTKSQNFFLRVNDTRPCLKCPKMSSGTTFQPHGKNLDVQSGLTSRQPHQYPWEFMKGWACRREGRVDQHGRQVQIISVKNDFYSHFGNISKFSCCCAEKGVKVDRFAKVENILLSLYLSFSAKLCKMSAHSIGANQVKCWWNAAVLFCVAPPH